MSRKKIIYIAGPFRGPFPWDVKCNVHEAKKLGLLVAKSGGTPLIPHAMYADFDKILPDDYWLDATLGLLERCDAIVLHPSWQKSAGSRGEVARAEELKMPVLDFARFVPALASVDGSFTALIDPFIRAVTNGWQPSGNERWSP